MDTGRGRIWMLPAKHCCFEHIFRWAMDSCTVPPSFRLFMPRAPVICTRWSVAKTGDMFVETSRPCLLGMPQSAEVLWRMNSAVSEILQPTLVVFFCLSATWGLNIALWKSIWIWNHCILKTPSDWEKIGGKELNFEYSVFGWVCNNSDPTNYLLLFLLLLILFYYYCS